jgi:hypothetical protein
MYYDRTTINALFEDHHSYSTRNNKFSQVAQPHRKRLEKVYTSACTNKAFPKSID